MDSASQQTSAPQRVRWNQIADKEKPIQDAADILFYSDIMNTTFDTMVFFALGQPEATPYHYKDVAASLQMGCQEIAQLDYVALIRDIPKVIRFGTTFHCSLCYDEEPMSPKTQALCESLFFPIKQIRPMRGYLLYLPEHYLH